MSNKEVEDSIDIKSQSLLSKFFNFFSKRSISDIIALESNERRLHESRGYYINIKQVVLAFLMEFVIIAVSLVGNYYLAVQTAALNAAAGALNDLTKDATFMLGMLGPVAFAGIETARVPLALSVRTHQSLVIKLLSAFGLLCSVGITAKTMISINQQVYEPRRAEVIKMKSDANLAANRAFVAQKNLDRTEVQLTAKREELKAVDKNILENRKVGSKCEVGTTTKLVGEDSVTSTFCLQNKAAIAEVKLSIVKDNLVKESILKQFAELEEDRKKANDELELVNKEKIIAEERYQIAVRGSQLHSLASILFGKDPMQVDDAEVSYLLKFLVYIPAFLVAFSSTLVAVTAVHRVRPKEDPRLIYPDGSEQFLLGPLTKTIIEKIKDDLARTQSEAAIEVSNAIRRSNESSNSGPKIHRSPKDGSDKSGT